MPVSPTEHAEEPRWYKHRLAYQGDNPECVWWDKRGRCTREAKWHFMWDDGLCDEHDEHMYELTTRRTSYAEQTRKRWSPSDFVGTEGAR